MCYFVLSKTKDGVVTPTRIHQDRSEVEELKTYLQSKHSSMAQFGYVSHEVSSDLRVFDDKFYFIHFSRGTQGKNEQLVGLALLSKEKYPTSNNDVISVLKKLLVDSDTPELDYFDYVRFNFSEIKYCSFINLTDETDKFANWFYRFDATADKYNAYVYADWLHIDRFLPSMQRSKYLPLT